MLIARPGDALRMIRSRGWGVALVVAVCTTLLAMGLVALLRPLIAPNFSSPFMAAIAVSALLAGRRAALLAFALAAGAIPMLYAETHGVASLATAQGLARFVTFLVSATAVTFVAGSLHAHRERAERQAGENLALRERAEEAAAMAEEEAERAAQEARRAAEAAEALRTARDELAAILRASPVAVVSLDPAGKVLTWNHAAERTFGWSAEEVIGRPLPNVPPAREAEFRDLRERVLRGDAFAGYETRRVRKGGQELDVLISTAPLHDGQGAVVGLVALYQDVTARKLLEADLRQAQKMEAVGQLAAGVAHDFNNVLTVINSQCELLQLLGPGGEGDEEIREIRTAVERAAHLTRQLLAFSRRQVLDFRVVNLNEVVRGIDTMLRSAIGDEIRLVQRLDPHLPNVRADAHQLEQVLLNLAVNARDAMPDGGSLLVETSRVHLEQDGLDPHLGARSGPHVLLCVTDTGVGMDPATQARIFEPFFTTKPTGRGTGLGLATAYGIVQQSGGHLSVYSEPGHGTCFRIYLPEHDGPVEPEPAPVPLPIPVDRQLTVLLVDDELAIRRAVTRLLESQGMRVLSAGGPEEAIEAAVAHAERIDLILSDVAMAGLDGVRLVERIRTMRPGTRALLMSGYTHEAITRLGRQALAHPLLVKPFTRATLLRAIHATLSGPPAEARGT